MQRLLNENNLHNGKVVIESSTVNFEFDIKEILNCDESVIGIPDDLHNKKKRWYFEYLNMNNPKSTIVKKSFVLPFHYKRYLIEYNNCKYIIITSANMTISAWGNKTKEPINYEFGIFWKLN